MGTAVIDCVSRAGASSSAPIRAAATRHVGAGLDHKNWDLVVLAQQGDKSALSALYERHVDMVFSFLLGRTRNRTLAEELTSETFVRVFRKIGSLTYRGTPFSAWAVTIARNLLFDYLRSAAQRYEVCFPEGFDAPSDTRELSAHVAERIAAEEVRSGMSQLTADQRECLFLRFFERLPVHEVALLMGRTDGSVRSLQLRAVRRLAEVLPRELATG